MLRFSSGIRIDIPFNFRTAVARGRLAKIHFHRSETSDCEASSLFDGGARATSNVCHDHLLSHKRLEAEKQMCVFTCIVFQRHEVVVYLHVNEIPMSGGFVVDKEWIY